MRLPRRDGSAPCGAPLYPLTGATHDQALSGPVSAARDPESDCAHPAIASSSGSTTDPACIDATSIRRTVSTSRFHRRTDARFRRRKAGATLWVPDCSLRQLQLSEPAATRQNRALGGATAHTAADADGRQRRGLAWGRDRLGPSAGEARRARAAGAWRAPVLAGSQRRFATADSGRHRVGGLGH